jgi:hypothetical protein
MSNFIFINTESLKIFRYALLKERNRLSSNIELRRVEIVVMGNIFCLQSRFKNLDLGLTHNLVYTAILIYLMWNN